MTTPDDKQPPIEKKQPDGKQQLSALWLLIAVAVMFAMTAITGMTVYLIGTTSIWLVAGISLACFLVGGIIIGWRSAGWPAVESAIAAALFTTIGLIVRRNSIALPGADEPLWWIVGIIGGFGLTAVTAAIGATIGRAMRLAEARAKKDGPDAFDLAGAWIAKHGALPALGAITIAVFVFHSGVFRGETVGDDLTFHFAESARLADCIRHGDFDFWNPSANGGYASAYYYQVIPQLASALPAALFGHHLFFFELSIALPLVLAPAAAYRGMRLMGATPWQAAVAAFAVAFMNGESRWGSGNAGTFQVGLYTQTWALCVFPLALGHGARWISEKKSLAPAIAWGAFAFLCHPFAGVSLGLALVMAFLFKFVTTWRLWLSPTMVGLIAVYLGGVQLVAIGAMALIPNVPVPSIAPVIAGVGAVMAVAGAVVMWKFHATDTIWKLESVQTIAGELHRLAILGVALVITTAPVLLPLTIDREGFGGFPHRVSDEVGPGYYGLGKWYLSGAILDFSKGNGMRLAILTFALPPVLVFTILTRKTMMRWLWAPATLFAVLLGLGPHVGKIGDDLFPPVRALGAMQIVLALGIGSGTVMLGQYLWNAPWDQWFSAPGKRPPPPQSGDEPSSLVYAMRTLFAAAAAALIVLIAVPGAKALMSRVRVLADYPTSHRSELYEVNDILAKQPQGRKQVGPGAENHWWNLLSYAYERVPSVLQMGGGGLQASPNYDFLWTERDYAKNAWIYDAPYLVFERSRGEKMPEGEMIGRTEHYEVRKLLAPGLVSPVQVVGVLPPYYRTGELGHIFALEWIKGDMPLRDQVLAYLGSGAAGPPPEGKTLRSWRQDSPGDDADIVAEVEATAPTTFLVHESWHPRWRAYVDGNEVAVRRVTPDFPAVDVGPGKHTIELRFERPLWALLIWLLWPGTAIAAWLVMRRLGRPNLPTARVVE